MLPAKYRLKKDGVGEVFKRGSRATGSYGSLTFLKQKECKVAVVVSKKVAASAVVRNRIRRRAYAAIGCIYPSIYPAHIAILPHKTSVDMQGIRLETEIKNLLEKARLLIS